jgi:RepB DNA-primase from phage plasmid
MNTPDQVSQRSSDYILENFKKTDVLACVLVNRRTGSVLQRLGTTRAFATSDFQDWLQARNGQGFDVYLSMNALHPDATRRTKQDVAAIRHLYLDFDTDGTASVERMKRESNLPPPNYELSTSPGKWQLVWKVDGFSKDDAEALQRSLAREWKADPAATDCARVMRLPGFFNHKYEQSYLVGVRETSNVRSTLAQFTVLRPSAPIDQELTIRRPSVVGGPRPAALSQSERDWSFANRALARGDAPEKVIAAIAAFRDGEKANPRNYAEHTVRKARQALEDAKSAGSGTRLARIISASR